MTKRLLAGALASISITIACLPAHAFEAEAVAQRLKALYSNQGGELAWSGVEADGSTVVIRGLSMQSPGIDPVTLGDLTLEGVNDDGSGGYTADTARLADFSQTFEGNGRVSVAGVELGKLKLAADNSPNKLDKFLIYETFKTDSVAVTIEGLEVASMSEITATIDAPATDGPLGYTATVGKMSAALAAIAEDEKQKAVLTQMGYDRINGRVDMAGSWNPVDGRLAMDKMAYTIDNAGTLDIGIDLTGYTVEFLEAMQQTTKAMDASGNQEAAGMAMLGLMQQLTFNGAKIRFDDNSLTGKILDFVAQQQGVSKSDVANMAKGTLPFMLANLKNPEFAAMVTDAVSTFLDNPGSLEIKATPASPQPFAVLMATGMSAPETFPQVLGVTVTANQ